MQIKLVKDFENAKSGSIIEIDEKDLEYFTKEGHIVYIVYTDIVKKEELATKESEFKAKTEKEIVMPETKEIKQEITAPNIVVPNKEIKSMGELFQKIAKGEVIQKVPAGMSENTGAGVDGGFLVDHLLYTGILGRMMEGGVIYPKCRKIQVGDNYNGMKLPYLNINTQSTTSQPRLYRIAEAASKVATKFTFAQHDLALMKLIALVPVTDELLQDKNMLEGYVISQIKGQFGWRMDNDLLFGTLATTGTMGVLDASAAAFITQPQAHAATMTPTIVQGLINGVSASLRGGAEWFMSGQAWSLIKAQMGQGVAQILNPLAGQETLGGYKVNVVDGMLVLNGAAKDILFGNWDQYTLIEKGGLQMDISKEFYFDTDQTCLRFVLRNAGAPTWAAYTAADGKAYAAFSTTS